MQKPQVIYLQRPGRSLQARTPTLGAAAAAAALEAAGGRWQRRGRGGCRASLGPGAGCARGRGVGTGPAVPCPRSAAGHDPGPDPPPAGSRRALSRVAAAADGHWPMVHLQADGTAELRLQAAVTTRGPSRRLPLLRRGHQAAEHRHPRPGRRRRPLSRPGGGRHRRDGAVWRHCSAPVLRHDSGRFALRHFGAPPLQYCGADQPQHVSGG